MKIAIFYGTRPEAIKLFPVIKVLRDSPNVDTRVYMTRQHPNPDAVIARLYQMRPDASRTTTTRKSRLALQHASTLRWISDKLHSDRPDVVIGQGDTTTCFSACLAAFYARIPFVHVEAGLRSGSVMEPWPEEAHRRMISIMATYHMIPTLHDVRNIDPDFEAGRRDVISSRSDHPETDRWAVTGNTVIDASIAATKFLRKNSPIRSELRSLLGLVGGRRIVIVTMHRRENIPHICNAMGAILRLAENLPGIAFCHLQHGNPGVSRAVKMSVDNHNGKNNLLSVPALDYVDFIELLGRSELIVSDSGGIQEEAVFFKSPVIMLRGRTDRGEAIERGVAAAVDPGSAEQIREKVTWELDHCGMRKVCADTPSIYGDGMAAERIVSIIERRGASWLTGDGK